MVSKQGAPLQQDLDQLKKYKQGSSIQIGGEDKKIAEVIDIDGLKLIFEDKSWLLIRPSGTEPKVRFYVESRTENGKNDLFKTAEGMLSEIGLL